MHQIYNKELILSPVPNQNINLIFAGSFVFSHIRHSSILIGLISAGNQCILYIMDLHDKITKLSMVKCTFIIQYNPYKFLNVDALPPLLSLPQPSAILSSGDL